jgi:hypothetical protein
MVRQVAVSHHSRRRFHVLQKPILGTADGEHWHRLGVRSFLLEIPPSMIAGETAQLSQCLVVLVY